ncbi:hypothetical protein QFZ65_003382 [Arthrobacter sp. B3I9]|nr:hypothetical protein [Arthrobacter sp. B3I9]
MFFLEPEVPGAAPDLVFSASDLVIAASCEYQLLRKLDEKLGRSPKATFEDDEMLKHAATLGDVHERRVLDAFVKEFGMWDAAAGRGVYDVATAETMDRATLLAKHSESVEALRSGADVVFQAAFFDGKFHGRSDFLVRQDDGSYAVFDTKLARHAKVTALLQLAAYGDQLLKAGITPDPAVTLVLGATAPLPGGGFDYVRSHHKLADILPVFRERRERFLSLTAGHVAQPGTVSWGAAGITACGRCDYCREMVKATDDLLLVARMNSAQRKALHKAGIFTVTELAQATLPDASPALRRLQEQARMQSGTGGADGGVRYVKDGEERSLRYAVLPDNTLDKFRHQARATSSSTSRATRFGRKAPPVSGGWSTFSASSKHPPKPAPRACSSRSGRTAGKRKNKPSWTSSPTWRSAVRSTRTCTSTTTPRTRRLPCASCP